MSNHHHDWSPSSKSLLRKKSRRLTYGKPQPSLLPRLTLRLRSDSRQRNRRSGRKRRYTEKKKLYEEPAPLPNFTSRHSSDNKRRLFILRISHTYFFTGTEIDRETHDGMKGGHGYGETRDRTSQVYFGC